MSSRARQLAVVLGGALAGAHMAIVPRVAQACAVCTTGRDDENQAAFLVSTIFLSLLPLAGLGTLVFVLWRRYARLEAEVAPAPSEAVESSV